MTESPEGTGSALALSAYRDIQPELLRVEENLRNLAHEEFPFLSELLGYVLATRGKRVRPAITVLASKFHPNDGELAVRMATAVELLHIATLIHDDTVDNSAMRRGRATASSLWGEHMAVLLGDYVFATSAIWVSDTHDVRVIRRCAETIKELSSGELMELLAARDWRVTREQYWQRLYNKTASLFLSAAESGAVLSGAPEETSQALRAYGHALGMAFQVVDDILDFEGTEAEVGKPVGNDLLQGTMTLPAIMLLERYPQDNPIPKLFQSQGAAPLRLRSGQASASSGQALSPPFSVPGPIEIVAHRSEPDSNLRRAIEMIQNSSIIQDSYTVAGEFCQQARDALASLPDNPYRHALVEMTEYVMDRRA